ncbi:MAG: PilT/PilU family type 4a pilus ATPase, partial [Endomicrobiales bacterium]
KSLMMGLLNDEQKSIFQERKTVDFSFAHKDLGCFRTNIYQQRGSVAFAIRHLPESIRSFKELLLPEVPLNQLCHMPYGLVLVCGPVGSGKTTTLAAMIENINQIRECHIITLEDPIEYRHINKYSIIHQREIGADTPDFKTGLRSILREDPDVVVVGEMRDLETIQAAVTVAETGHLVFATLHTSDTSESIRRIIDVFPGDQQQQIITQLSATLCGVVEQTLLPRAGIPGRIVATELMLLTPAIQNIIRENKIEQIYSLIQMGNALGMHTMNQSLCELVSKGSISRETALQSTRRQPELIRLLDHF